MIFSKTETAYELYAFLRTLKFKAIQIVVQEGKQFTSGITQQDEHGIII